MSATASLSQEWVPGGATQGPVDGTGVGGPVLFNTEAPVERGPEIQGRGQNAPGVPTQAAPVTAPGPEFKPGVGGRDDNGQWNWPSTYQTITSPFGFRSDPLNGSTAFHSGLDLGTPCGTNISATKEGTVTFAGVAGGYGNRIQIDHGNGLSSTYNHLQTIGVTVGQKVMQDEVIAFAGTTGRSTGCHLHFEILIDGQFTDPLPFLTGQPSANPAKFGDGGLGYVPTPDGSAAPTPSAGTGPLPPCTVDIAKDQAAQYGGSVPTQDKVNCTPVNVPSASPSPSTSAGSSPSTSVSPSSTPVPSGVTTPPTAGPAPSKSAAPSASASETSTPETSAPVVDPSTTPTAGASESKSPSESGSPSQTPSASGTPSLACASSSAGAGQTPCPTPSRA